MGFEDIIKMTGAGGPVNPPSPMAQFTQRAVPQRPVSQVVDPSIPPQQPQQPQQVADASLLDRAKQVFQDFLFGQKALRKASGQPEPYKTTPQPDFAPGQYEQSVRQYQQDADRALGKKRTPSPAASPKPSAAPKKTVTARPTK
jgi:hypothetical protein